MSEIDHLYFNLAPSPPKEPVQNVAEIAGRLRTAKSPQYQRACRDRSIEARHGLIVAGMAAFGQFGFEAATFRDISKKAGVTMAAALYHFGTKQRLYEAVVDYVIEQMNRRLERSLKAANNFVADSNNKVEARKVLRDIVGAYVNTLFFSEESEIWARFILRERMYLQSDAFYRYDQHLHDLIGAVVASIFDIDSRSSEAMIRASAIVAQLSAFGSNQPFLLRRLGRPNLSRQETATVKRILLDHVERIVGSDLTPVFSPTWS